MPTGIACAIHLARVDEGLACKAAPSWAPIRHSGLAAAESPATSAMNSHTNAGMQAPAGGSPTGEPLA